MTTIRSADGWDAVANTIFYLSISLPIPKRDDPMTAASITVIATTSMTPMTGDIAFSPFPKFLFSVLTLLCLILSLIIFIAFESLAMGSMK